MMSKCGKFHGSSEFEFPWQPFKYLTTLPPYTYHGSGFLNLPDHNATPHHQKNHKVSFDSKVTRIDLVVPKFAV
jgi:hypothetical protein